MRKKIRILSFILVGIFLLSSSTPTFAKEMPSDTLSICYNSVVETEDGNFIFTYSEENSLHTRSSSHVKKTSYLVIPENEKYYNELKAEINQARNSGIDASIYDTAVDNSSSYTIYMTVNYDKVYSGGRQYLKVVSVNGGFYGAGGTSLGNYVGSGVYIESQSLEVQSSGNLLNQSDSRYIEQKKEVSFSNTESSWSYNTPTDWIHVYQYSMPYAYIGAIFEVVARRGTSGTGSLCTAKLTIEYEST